MGEEAERVVTRTVGQIPIMVKVRVGEEGMGEGEGGGWGRG